MAILDLFVVALLPVLKTLLITAVGLLLALDRVDILGAAARHHLNNLVFFVFSPSLVVSSLAETITSKNIVTLWFMPVNILLTFIIGSALGWMLVKVTRTPYHLQGLIIGCCSAGNLGNLLLIIIPTVCKEKHSPFGDSSSCATRGEAYASLSMAIGAVYIWSYVYNIIRMYGVQSSLPTDIIKDSADTTVSESCKQALLSNDCLKYSDEEIEATLSFGGSENREKAMSLKTIKYFVKVWAERINLKMLFAPATIATIFGLTIGAVSPLRELMIGDNAPLRVIDNSASIMGEATIPAMTLIVGANLLRGLKRSEVGFWLVLGVQVVRYIALPLSGIVVVKAASHFGLVGSDSLYQFILMLQYALPSAMTIGTITQLFEVGESECSVIMLWNYAAAAISLTLWTTYFMWILS